MYDVVIIGSGPAGYVSAIKASQNGLKTACIEKSINKNGNAQLGGTCLNVGCIPSKALLDSSYKYIEALNQFSKHGLEISEPAINLSKMMDRKNEIVNQLTGGVTHLFKLNNVTSFLGEAKIIDSSQVQVCRDGKTEIIKTKNVVIASGSEPISIPVAPIDNKNIVDSKGALEFGNIPKRIAIMGAGIIGLELGSVWARLGSEVVLIEAMDEFLPMADRKIARDLLRELKTQGLTTKFGCKVTKTETRSKGVTVYFKSKGDSDKLEVDKLIIAVGRKAYTKELIDDKCKVSFDKDGFIKVNKFCETSVKNIWAIGDVVRGPMLAHKASEEGIMVADQIAGKSTEINYDQIPSVIYTHPEVAWVGKNEKELSNAGTEFKSGIYPFRANARALVAGDPSGFVKVLTEKKIGTVLGVHVFGPSAADIIQQGVIAMGFGAKAKELGSFIFSHPTVSEALKEASLSVHGNAINIGNKIK